MRRTTCTYQYPAIPNSAFHRTAHSRCYFAAGERGALDGYEPRGYMRGNRGSMNQAVHHSPHLHRMVSHQIAVQSQQRQRTARAAYLAIADIMVCMLSDALVLQLGVSTSARSVVLSRASQRHIVARRAIARSGDAQLAADRVHEAFADLRFQRLPQRRANTFELVGYVGSAK